MPYDQGANALNTNQYQTSNQIYESGQSAANRLNQFGPNRGLQMLLDQQAAQEQLIRWSHPVEMTREDLGIIDQLLDDKLGMEP